MSITFMSFKTKNPNATLFTNIAQWQNFSLQSAYFPKMSFFWGRKFKPGKNDTLNLKLL